MTDYTRRSTDLALVHPQMREAAERLLDACARQGVKFIVWEAFRHPERQDYLFRTKIKGRGGRMIRRTKARAWQSYHQYGVACDFVLDMPDCGRWATKTDEQRGWWRLLHAEGAALGLEPLSFEKPHLQLVGVDRAEFRKGVWPPGGDDPWVWAIREAMQRHQSRRKPIRPPAYPNDTDRPMTSDGLESS